MSALENQTRIRRWTTTTSSSSPTHQLEWSASNTSLNSGTTWTEEDTNVCKRVSYILRHRAVARGLNIRPDGYVSVRELLETRDLEGVDWPSLAHIVRRNMKRRFSVALEYATGEWVEINPEDLTTCLEGASETESSSERFPKIYVRALQGHSMPIIKSHLLYHPVNSLQEIPVCVHGTYWWWWNSILEQGLLRKTRLHIHFAKGLPGDPGVVSGVRGNAEVAIYIDVAKAMTDGVHFWLSRNGVILSEGINGVIPPKYFLRAVSLPDRKPVALVPIDKNAIVKEPPVSVRRRRNKPKLANTLHTL